MSGRRGPRLGGMARIGVGLIALTASVAGCTSDSKGPKPISTADAYLATIRWYVDSLPEPPVTTDGDEPGPAIVYVASESGKAIASDVQASVVQHLADMKDDVTVRFTDDRDDALVEDDETLPVIDDGVLLLVGDVEEARPPINVEVIVYRNIDDEQTWLMKVLRSNDAVTATAETVAEPG